MNTPAVSDPGQRLQPPLIIDSRDHSRLRQLAEDALDRAPDVAERLLEEIDRAEVLPPDAMPEDVVRIGSLVTYQDERSGSIRTIRLVPRTVSGSSPTRSSGPSAEGRSFECAR